MARWLLEIQILFNGFCGCTVISRCLASLRQTMLSQKPDLAPQGSDKPTSESLTPGGAAGARRPEVEEAAWRLAWLSSELGDDTMAAFAGELIARVGPLDPATIAFSAPKSASDALPLPAADAAAAPRAAAGRPSAAAVGRLGSGGEGNAPAPMLLLALRQLADLLVDGDVSVISTAQFTLRQLLRSAEGQNAIEALDATTQSYLRIYVRKPLQERPGVAPVLPIDPLWDLAGNASLFLADDKPYSQWVCNLTHAILRRVGSPTLRYGQFWDGSLRVFYERTADAGL